MLDLPSGTKRITGFVIMIIPVILPLFGFEVSDAAPIQMAQLSDSLVGIIGAIVLLYGEYKAKAPMWFAKVNK